MQNKPHESLDNPRACSPVAGARENVHNIFHIYELIYNIYILADPANLVLPYKLFLGSF